MSFINEAFGNIPSTSLLGNIDYFASVAQDILDLNLDGDIAECGVYKGGSARLLATIFPHKKIFLFDSFEGMIENDILEKGHKKGDFNDTSLKEVKSYLSDKPNCAFFSGWIPSSASFLNEERFCFVHLDLDLYQSTKAAIEIFWPKVVDGGVIVFDDWEWENCPGVKQSVTEYFDDQEIRHKREINNNTCSIFKI
jgi:hypothetical protein